MGIDMVTADFITILDMDDFGVLAVTADCKATGRLYHKGTCVMLADVWTDPDVRKRGYAGRVVTALIEVAIKKEKKAVSLWVDYDNQEAINLYKRLGFCIASDDCKKQFYMVRSLERIK